MNFLDSFLNYLTFEKRCSEHTVISYKADLLQFFNFIQFHNNDEMINDLSEIGSCKIRAWVLEMMSEETHIARSIHRKMSALKSFFRYHIKMGNLQSNPMLQVHSPKMPKRLPQFVEELDIEKLFTQELFEENFEGTRDQTILELFYSTGMRVSELKNLTFSDIDLYNMQVKVLGKRNKERLIPFGATFQNIYNKYVSFYNENFGESVQNKFVFVNVKSAQLTSKKIYTIVRKYLDMVTTIDKRSPHVIRHSFATHLLNRGADLNSIKELLGHSSLAATQVYTHNSIEKLKTIYQQAHSRA